MAHTITMFMILMTLNERFQSQTIEEDSEEGISKRVKVLKDELLAQIKRDQIEAVPGLFDLNDRSNDVDPNIDYQEVETEGQEMITPIMDFNIEKLKNELILDPLKGKKIVTVSKAPVTSSTKEIKIKPLRVQRKKRKKKSSSALKPSDIFYRRDNKNFEKPLKWAHCLVLLTPYLFEEKHLNPEDDYNMKHLTVNDTTVLRLVHLLSIDTKDSTADEIHSVLWHISNTPIRFFQWTEPALRLLFNEIIAEKAHNFRNLKNGIKALFAKWHLDISNTTNLLKQTKIFRPPCIKTTLLSGSTKSSHGTRYTKSKPSKKTCKPSEEVNNSCEE